MSHNERLACTGMPEPTSTSSLDESLVAVPSHPLKVKPAGNAYGSVENIKSAAGLFYRLPDELIVHILEYLGPTSLLQLGCTCKAMFAFSRLEEVWKTLFVEYASPSGQDLISTVYLFLVEPGPKPWWTSIYS